MATILGADGTAGMRQQLKPKSSSFAHIHINMPTIDANHMASELHPLPVYKCRPTSRSIVEIFFDIRQAGCLCRELCGQAMLIRAISFCHRLCSGPSVVTAFILRFCQIFHVRNLRRLTFLGTATAFLHKEIIRGH